VNPELVVPVAASIGAVLVALLAFLGVALTGRTARRAQEESWRRQDDVAAQAKLDAQVVAAAATKLQSTNEVQVRESRAAAAATREQLAKIQTTGEATKKFVDGAYTAQLQVELSVQRSMAAILRQNIALLQRAGEEVPKDALDVLAVTDARIAELVPLIAERVAYMAALAEAALAAINQPKEVLP
jgi:hypothetical protein